MTPARSWGKLFTNVYLFAIQLVEITIIAFIILSCLAATVSYIYMIIRIAERSMK